MDKLDLTSSLLITCSGQLVQTQYVNSMATTKKLILTQITMRAYEHFQVCELRSQLKNEGLYVQHTNFMLQ